MQNYSDIIGLNKYFKPYYDITNESANYWKTFIPNDKFFSLMNGCLNSFESRNTKDKKSIWVQGTYGTGKSHATGVLKHLLFEPEKVISNFINNFQENQIKFRIQSFRKKHRVFPVVLKGVSNITNNASFSLEIEKAVKTSLKKNSISISIDSDFEKIINQITKNPLNIDWDKNICRFSLKVDPLLSPKLTHPKLVYFPKIIHKLITSNVFHTKTLALNKKRIGVMKQPIQYGSSNHIIHKYLTPLFKRFITGNDHRSFLISFGNQFKKQLC